MNKTIVYALDFDGVICDSAIETGISGWKAASQIWGDFDTPEPSLQLIEQFRQVRPVMGTGYEAIALIRMLHDGDTVDSIIKNFVEKKEKVFAGISLNIDELKQLFGETRDNWIKQDLNDWVIKNPLFPGIADKLRNLSERSLWYIVTTKQERFVKKILKANNIELADDRIFGLDRNKPKAEILLELQAKHEDVELCFVEDMLSALLKVVNHGSLDAIKLFLVSWGYNLEQDRRQVGNYLIELIDMDGFLV